MCCERFSEMPPILASKTDVSPSPRPVGTVSWLLGYRKADARVVGNCESVYHRERGQGRSSIRPARHPSGSLVGRNRWSSSCQGGPQRFSQSSIRLDAAQRMLQTLCCLQKTHQSTARTTSRYAYRSAPPHLAKVSHSFSVGMSRRFPMNGNPLGPGGRCVLRVLAPLQRR